MLETPVALFLYKRPDTTRRVWREIARVRPKRVFLIGDGPSNSGEAEACATTRRSLQPNWDCDVVTNYSPTHLGCGQRVATGLTWVFERCEEAIILEDDCVPHPSFFFFCGELLRHYREDDRVMAISGNNFQFGRSRVSDSYYFSRYCHVWGWATWKRAWANFDAGMSRWPTLRSVPWLRETLKDHKAARYWTQIFDRMYSGQIDSWAYPWLFTCWVHGGLTAIPVVNLVSNIGFGPGATHTGDASDGLANLPAMEMVFPLRHPPAVRWHRSADRFVSRRVYLGGQGRSWRAKLVTRLAQVVCAIRRRNRVRTRRSEHP